MQTLDQRSASSHYTLHRGVHVDCQPCILVEFIYWYWTFSTNNWGDLCLLEVSLRPLDAGMGNVHYLEYVHTFILEYFPSEYYRKHISLIICFITAFVNLGVLLSRGNSNIFQGPNLPGPNLTIRTIEVWYRYQDELGFHPAVKGVAPLSWKEVLPLFLSFLVTMLSIYFFRAHLQSSRQCSSLHEISSFSLWVFCEGPWDGRCHSCCTWWARCTSCLCLCLCLCLVGKVHIFLYTKRLQCTSLVPQTTCFFKSDGDPVLQCTHAVWKKENTEQKS